MNKIRKMKEQVGKIEKRARKRREERTKLVTNLIGRRNPRREAARSLFLRRFTRIVNTRAADELIYFCGPLITELSLLSVANLIPIRVYHGDGSRFAGGHFNKVIYYLRGNFLQRPDPLLSLIYANDPASPDGFVNAAAAPITRAKRDKYRF